MARPLRIEYEGAFYHVTSRGNEKKEIFKNRRDREQFLSYLQSAVERYDAVIHAYCLMTNHYHLLLETPRGNLSQIMRHLNGAYTTYFNVKRQRSGHLFQGRYKAIIVEADEYALELSRYLHLNPVRAGIVSRPQDHEWSSYRGYAGISPAPLWLTQNLILSHFSAPSEKSGYRKFVEDLIGKTYETPLKAVVASTLLGTPGFVADVSEKHASGLKPDRHIPSIKHLVRCPSAEKVLEAVKEVVGAENGLWRKVSIHLCQRHTGMRLKDIGEKFGIGDSAVSVTSKRVHALAENNPKIQEVLRAVRVLLNVET